MSEQGRSLGRYELLTPLGRGTVFETHKARSFGVEGFEKKLVVKSVLPELGSNDRFVSLFIEEAQRALRLSHANVTQVFDLGHVHEGKDLTYFMATEYVAGLDLETLIRRSRNAAPWPVALCLYLGCELAKALDHAHRRRDEELRPMTIVHGAISPRNVLVSWDGDVKLTDFGMSRPLLACVSEPDNALDHVYAALSPEQAAGGVADATSDVFSLGSLLYEILAGVNPFATQNGKKTLDRVRAGKCPPPSAFRKDLPDFVSDLVMRALSPSPSARPASASLFFEELSAALYRLEEPFGSEELASFVESYREEPPVSAPAIDTLLNRPLSLIPPPDEGRDTYPSLPPLAGFTDTRHASALVLVFRQRAEVPESIRDKARDLVHHYGGYIVEDRPRGVAALFGLDQGDGCEAQSAVHCGLVLVRTLAVDVLRPAVGIHVGRVRVHEDGSPVMDHECESLLAKARVVGEEAERRVLVSHGANKYLRGRFALQAIGEVFAISKATPYGGPSERFVGRRTELSYLADLLARSSRGSLQVVAVAGEAGIGKTRLIEEMRRRLQRGGFDLGFYVAACPPRGRALPYSGIGSILRRIFGVAEGDFSERTGVEPKLRALGIGDDEIQAVLAHLGPAKEATHPTIAALLHTAVVRIFQRLTDDGFQVFVWDDAQELDASSVQLLHALCARLESAPMTLLFSMRPEPGAPCVALPFHAEVQLGELDDGEADRLLALRLGVESTPSELSRFVRLRAGGHPMFVEELARHALESEAVVVEEGTIARMDLTRASEVPSSLTALIAGRLRRLPVLERDLTVAAAVLDDPARLGVLAVMLDVTVPEADAAATMLEARDILKRNDAMALSFVSPLWRDVLLSELEPSAATDLHQRAAEAYQGILSTELEEEGHRIGYHLAAAGQWDRAADFYATSGLHYLKRRKLHRAIVDLSSAIDLADLDVRAGPQLGNWVRALSNAVRFVRADSGIRQIVDKVRDRAEHDARFEGRLRVQVLIDVAVMLGGLQRYGEARAVLDQCERDARKWPQAERALFAARGELAAQQGEPLLALQALEQALGLPAGDAIEQHRVAVSMMLAFSAAGKAEQARVSLSRAEKLVSDEDVVLASERRRLRAILLGREGQWRQAAEAARLASDTAREAGLLYESAMSLVEQALALLRVGELLRAQDALKAALDVAREIGAYRPAHQAKVLLGYVAALSGGDAQANDLVDAIFVAEQEGWTGDVLLARYLLAKLLVRQGAIDAARRELTANVEHAMATGNRVMAEDCRAELKALDVM